MYAQHLRTTSSGAGTSRGSSYTPYHSGASPALTLARGTMWMMFTMSPACKAGASIMMDGIVHPATSICQVRLSTRGSRHRQVISCSRCGTLLPSVQGRNCAMSNKVARRQRGHRHQSKAQYSKPGLYKLSSIHSHARRASCTCSRIPQTSEDLGRPDLIASAKHRMVM